jgi:hypothetical protein
LRKIETVRGPGINTRLFSTTSNKTFASFSTFVLSDAPGQILGVWIILAAQGLEGRALPKVLLGPGISGI